LVFDGIMEQRRNGHILVALGFKDKRRGGHRVERFCFSRKGPRYSSAISSCIR
jgi:hypothetical protein